MIGKVVTGCVVILSYHTPTQDRGSECRDFGFISRIVTALIYLAVHLLNEHCATSELTALYFIYNPFLFNCFKFHFKSISISF